MIPNPEFPSPASSSGRKLAFALLLMGLVGLSEATAQFSDQVIEMAKGFSVQILRFDSDGKVEGNGSGFFISEDGHVATNFHVVEDAAGLMVVFSINDRVFFYPGEVVVVSEKEDLAILKASRFRGAGVAVLAVAPPSSGQKVMAIGFPGALDTPTSSQGLTEVATGELKGSPGAVAPFVPATFSGEVGRFQQEAEIPFGDGSVVRADTIQHSAKTSGGNSGGVLIDVEGRAAGVVFAVGSDDSGSVDYAFAIHSAHLAELARAHGIAVKVSSARASLPKSGGTLHLLLILAVAALAVVTFLLVLRKPRMVLVDSVSRVIGYGRQGRAPVAPVRNPAPLSASDRPGEAAAPPGARSDRMVLRGRDLEGRSYHLVFDPGMFRQSASRLFLGRNAGLCQLVIPQDSVSRQHAVLSWRDGRVWLEDRNSGNGTQINGRSIALGEPPVALRPGDKVTLGEVELVFDLLT